jgi:hypothetical protein
MRHLVIWSLILRMEAAGSSETLEGTGHNISQGISQIATRLIELTFSRQWRTSALSSGMWRCVAWYTYTKPQCHITGHITVYYNFIFVDRKRQYLSGGTHTGTQSVSTGRSSVSTGKYPHCGGSRTGTQSVCTSRSSASTGTYPHCGGSRASTQSVCTAEVAHLPVHTHTVAGAGG